MKKLKTIGAMVLLCVGSYAQYVLPDADNMGCKFVFSSTTPSLSVDTTIAKITGVYAASTMEIVVKEGQVFEGVINPYTHDTYGLTFAYNATAELSDKVVWKLKNEYIQADGVNRALIFTGNVGDKIVLHIASKGATENLFTLIGCTDDDPSLRIPVKETNLIYTTKTYTMTESPAILYVSQGGYCIDWAYVGANPVGCKQTIASSLLKKVGNELQNPTDLSVEVYNCMGNKLLSSSQAAINISNLAPGVYIATTNQGVLKFIK